jgi:hypothetical protein
MLQNLADRPELVWAAGRRAREVFLRHYDMPEGVARVCEALGCAVEENVRASAAI